MDDRHLALSHERSSTVHIVARIRSANVSKKQKLLIKHSHITQT